MWPSTQQYLLIVAIPLFAAIIIHMHQLGHRLKNSQTTPELLLFLAEYGQSEQVWFLSKLNMEQKYV